ncbi:MAG: polyketide cyclase/dehydrase and lipid transport [Leptospira sp.]|nr:MAG: polyketide cyclase/dehydrase and lipid transport [Leptospira sp.]
MLITKHSIRIKVKPEAIWKLWEKIDEWPKWDHGIETSQLDGRFEAGSQGWLKPKGAPKVSFVIIEAVPFKKFHDRSFLPLTKLDFIHTIEQEGEYSVVTHQVEMTGLLTFIFSKIIGTGIKKDMPTAMEKLIQQAELTR